MKVTLFIADRKLNSMMTAFDMCPAYKVFTTPVDKEIEHKGTDSNESFILRMIEFSKSQKGYWVPAIMHNGKLYASEGIKEISDGETTMIVNR
jgi:hypothetical protein